METTVLANLPYFWAAVGVLFLIVEVTTGTFYGLAVALAAFVTATYVLVTGDRSWALPQFLVFFGASLVLCVALPNLMTHKGHAPVGLEATVGRPAKLRKAGEHWKIDLDGVQYLVHDDCVRPDFSEGKSVKVSGVKDGLPTVG